MCWVCHGGVRWATRPCSQPQPVPGLSCQAPPPLAAHILAHTSKPLTGVASAACLLCCHAHARQHLSLDFYWGPALETAFQALKTAIQQAPVLATPDLSKPYTVYVDASTLATSGVLLQTDDNNHLHPLAYISNKLEPAQLNYTIGEPEMLAIVHALRCWRCFLEGADFTIWTGHSNLTSFLSSPTISGRQSRWASFLQQFLPGMSIRYKKGTENMADALSRRPDQNPKTCSCYHPWRCCACTCCHCCCRPYSNF